MDFCADCEDYYSYTAHPLPSKRRHIQWLLGQKVPLLGLIVGSMIFLLLGFIGRPYVEPAGSSSHCAFGESLTRFELNSTFTEPPSPQTNAAWSGLIPNGRGFVVVDESENPIKFTGGRVQLANVRSVSVFHQLHCLNELRIGYYANNPAQKSILTTAEHSTHHHSPAHMKHCFDYLRQALMCAADTTLENLQTDTSRERPGVDGWGTMHRCRDYDEISLWTRIHRASGDGGID